MKPPWPSLNWQPAAGELVPGACLRVEFRFVVDTLGRPEPGTITLVSQNNRGFADAIRAMLDDLRYVPGRIGDRPVRQVVTYKDGVGTQVSTGNEGVGSGFYGRTSRC